MLYKINGERKMKHHNDRDKNDTRKMLEILASENKLKIIAHYYNCTCEGGAYVNDLQEELVLTQ